MFAYCGNEPVNRSDSTGYIHAINNSDMIARGGCADITSKIVFRTAWIALLFNQPDPLPEPSDPSKSVAVTSTKSTGLAISKEKERAYADTIAITTDPSDVVIYRYNASKTKNLAPRIGRDYDGLSFSTIPPKPGQKAVCTTINTVNSTGLLQAIQVGTHVSIVPTFAPVTSWMAAGMDSVWTKVLSAIVFEVKG